MLTASASVLPETYNYSPDDLESMRHAYRRACDENPTVAQSEAERYSLAKAIVNRFRRGISETELIALALRKAH
ncbi:MAG TPA: hypothetical protein VM144_01485 [Aestuariivirga sp.]|nr:hypothetical protein [Aestuariivirga sp.]